MSEEQRECDGRESETKTELYALDKARYVLAEHMNQLVDRLVPVLQESKPEDAKQSEETESSLCPFARKIRAVRRGLNDLDAQLTGLLDRLEI